MTPPPLTPPHKGEGDLESALQATSAEVLGSFDGASSLLPLLEGLKAGVHRRKISICDCPQGPLMAFDRGHCNRVCGDIAHSTPRLSWRGSAGM